MAKCETCGQEPKRSLPQNNRLHLLFNEMSKGMKSKDGEYHSALWWKVNCVHQWLGYDEFLRPDGVTIYVLKRTSQLDVAELNKFMEKVERYAAHNDVWLQDND